MIVLLAGSTETLAPMVLLRNRFAEGVLEGTNIAAGFPVANLLGPQTFDYWKASALPAEFSVLLAVAAGCDCVAFAGHNLGTSGASVTLFYSITDVSAWIALGTFTLPDDDAAAVMFPTVTGRRFRVVINSGSAMPFIAVAMAGPRLIFPADVGPGYVPANHARRVEVFPSLSMEGQFLGSRIKRRGGDMSVAFPPLPRAWVDATMTEFQRHFDDGKTFFWAACPEKYPSDICYAWRAERADELRPSYTEGGRFAQVRMELATYGA